MLKFTLGVVVGAVVVWQWDKIRPVLEEVWDTTKKKYQAWRKS